MSNIKSFEYNFNRHRSRCVKGTISFANSLLIKGLIYVVTVVLIIVLGKISYCQYFSDTDVAKRSLEFRPLWTILRNLDHKAGIEMKTILPLRSTI